MCLLYTTAYVVLLVVAQGAVTNSDNQTDIPSANVTSPIKAPTPPIPGPFWCPYGYELMKTQGKWIHACRPWSCPGQNRTCKRLSKTLRLCPKMFLDEDEYTFDDNGALVDMYHNSSVRLGDYAIVSTQAIICNPRRNVSSSRVTAASLTPVALPKWCMPLVVPNGHYSISGTKLLVHGLNLQVDHVKIDDDGTAHICTDIDPVITDTCGATNRGILTGEDFEVMPDMSIKHVKGVFSETVYRHGEYLLAEDRSFVIICIVPEKPIPMAVKYVNAVASILSSICLLLALLAHMFFPTLNYHARALLCLAFSFLVMYITMTIRTLYGHFRSPSANMALFSVTYISSLGAFFWLSILAFDLWRVFHDMRGTINHENTPLKKRIFLAKCVYAWGIPTVLCITVLCLTHNPDLHKNLGLDLKLKVANWFHDIKTILIMFYTPIIIVLVENVLFFILTIVNLCNATKGTEMLRCKKRNKKLLRVYVKLFLVMGLCWFFEVISYFSKTKTGREAWYATDVINCLQGVFIFFIYVFKRKTLRIIKHKLGYITTSQMNTNTSSTQDGVKMDSIPSRNAQPNNNVN